MSEVDVLSPLAFDPKSHIACTWSPNRSDKPRTNSDKVCRSSGRNLKDVLGATVSKVEETVDRELARTTVADLVADLARREREKDGAA